MWGFTSSCTCAKSHPGISSPLKHSLISNDTADSEGPDQTVWMRRLIWALADHICPNTCFCMAPPISLYKNIWSYWPFLFLRAYKNMVFTRRGLDTPRRFSTILYKHLLSLPVCVTAHPAPSVKGSTLKRKNLLPGGANSFVLE